MKNKIFILFSFLFIVSSPSFAAIINVVDDGTDAIGIGNGCSLREAIINANNDDQSGSTDCTAGSGADEIILESGITYNLTIATSGEDLSATGDLDILDDLTINTSGLDKATIDATGLTTASDPERIFHILGSALNVTLENIILQDGRINDDTDSPDVYYGAGIYMASVGGTLTLNTVEMYDNTLETSGAKTMRGAGIAVVDGNLSLNDSIIQSSEIDHDVDVVTIPMGGGIYFSGAYNISLNNSEILDNTIFDSNKEVSGGGLYVSDATSLEIIDSSISYNITSSDISEAFSAGLHVTGVGSGTITNSIFDGNSTRAPANIARGGGIYVFESTLDILNSTITHNDASGDDSYGGGIFSSNSNTIKVSFSTFTDNAAGDVLTSGDASGGGIYNNSTLNVINSILANNGIQGATSEIGTDCFGITSLGNNLIEDNTNCDSIESDITGSDPSLLAVTDNGGNTETRALDESIPSPAIDAGTCFDASGYTVTTDQRGAPRNDGSCDIGAYEYGLFYTDADSDGYGDSTTETEIFSAELVTGIDCNDSDANVSPAEAELCGDAVDNNCDATIDEGFETVGDTCSVGTGACEDTGVIVCSEDALSVECDATEGTASDELCGDDIDNDCDGGTDEGFETVGAACSVGTGACEDTGVIVCSEDALSVECDATEGTASDELCGDDIDNDCDGDSDADDADCPTTGDDDDDTTSSSGGCQLNTQTSNGSMSVLAFAGIGICVLAILRRKQASL